MDTLERTTPERAGIPSGLILRWLDALEATGTEMHGMMLARHGRVCAEGWWKPYAPEMIHSQQSLTKTYAVTALGALHDEGLLSLEERVADILPEYLPPKPDGALREMTVRHLLCMSSGMRGRVDIADPQWLRRFFEQPVEEAPGAGFQYSGICTAVGAAILRKRTGCGLLEYMGPRILERIGIDASRVKSLRMGDGLEYAGGGFFTTTEDNLRLIQLYLNRGLWAGRRVLSEAWCEEVTRRQIDTAGERAHNPGSEDNYVGYGLQCWMCRPQGVYRADGAMGQFAIAVPRLGLAVSITQTADLRAHQQQKVLDTVWDVLLPGVLDGPAPEDAGARRALEERLSALALPVPAYRAPWPDAPDVSGLWWRLEENRDFLLPGVRFGAVGMEEAGIDGFSLRMRGGETALRFFQHGRPQEIRIGTAEAPAINEGRYGPVGLRLLWAAGGWLERDVFGFQLRMLESCFSEMYAIRFEGETATVRAVSGGAQPGTPPGVPRVLRARLWRQKPAGGASPRTPSP